MRRGLSIQIAPIINLREGGGRKTIFEGYEF